MAHLYIKDLIKSMLKMDGNNLKDCHTHSTVSICSRGSTEDETDQETVSSLHAVGGFQTSNMGQARGRSVKEFEETLTALRKENFNLKLRIYFLEERLGNNFSMDKENAVKKNIELKVEVESLKKELAEKQDLLCQAVKAMELDEEEHTKVKEEQEKKINNLQAQLDSLQHKYDEELRCRGDHGFEDDKEYYERNIDVEGKDCGHEPYIRDLENKVKDLEESLKKSKESARELENLLQLTDSRSNNLTAIEEELKEKDNTLKKQQLEIEERNKVVSNYRIRISKLEDDLLDRKTDIEFIAKELKEKGLLVQELKRDNEELQKLLTEAQSSLTSERRKIEKNKLSVYERNKRIMELEDEVKHLTKLSKAQAQFEVKTEVQRKHDGARKPLSPHTDANKFAAVEPSKGNVPCGDEYVYSPRASSLSQLKHSPSSPMYDRHRIQSKSLSPAPAESSSANVVMSQYSSDQKDYSLDQLKETVGHYKQQISMLEQDQRKAYKIIQVLTDNRKKNSKEIDELKSVIIEKDDEIKQLSQKIKKLPYKDIDISMTESYSNHLLSANPSSRCLSMKTGISKTSQKSISAEVTNNETSAADLIEDPKLLLEQYKELTDNLEEQKQVLLCTVEETKNQLEDLELKCDNLRIELKARENRIVDLEFEVLSLTQGITGESLGMGEKSDVGNEKPASFFIKEIEEKDREIERLESELKKRTCDLQAIVNKELWEKNREIEKLTKRYNEIISVKEQELNQLEGDLSSKTQQLEVLTDRISELGIVVRHEDDTFEIIKKENLELCSLEIKLNECIKERDFFKSQLVEFDNKFKVALEKAFSDSQRIAHLENELQIMKDETEKSENLRQDAMEVCSILSRRLEELAHFLDSLLKQKSILGYLGSKKNDKLRQLINQSLDISRTLSLSMTFNGNQSLMQLSNLSALLNTSMVDEKSYNEYELSQMPMDVSLTYQSHFSQTDQPVEEGEIIAALRSQIEKQKKEIHARDIELEKLGVSLEKGDNSQVKTLSVMRIDEMEKEDEEIMDVLLSIVPESHGAKPSSQQIYETLVCTKVNMSGENPKFGIENSESESWSEPDRAVSKARIGLGDCLSAKQSKEDICSTEDDPEKCNSSIRLASRKSILAENRQTIINLHEQICEMEAKLKDKEAEVEKLAESCSDITRQLEAERKTSEELHQKDSDTIAKLTQERDDLVEKLAETELRLKNAETVKDETQMQLVELQKTIEEVKTSQQLLQETVDLKNKDAQNKMNELELEKGLLAEKLTQAEQRAQESITECKNTEKKLQLLKDEIQFLERNLREELQLDWEEKFRAQDENYEMKLKLLENTAEAELKMFRDEAEAKISRITDDADLQIKQLVLENQDLQRKYDAECMQRVEVDKVMGSIKELEKFKKVVNEAEKRIHSLEDSERKLKQQLLESDQEHETKINKLHEELEKANLTFSEALLEKTHILAEKNELEFRFKEFADKEIEFARQVSEYKDDFANMKDTFQKQLAHLESQKSRLELRIGELEQVNAELRNRIVRFQATENPQQGTNKPSTSPAPASSRILELFLNKTVPANFRRQQSDNSEVSDEHSSCGGAGRNIFAVPVAPGSVDLERQHANSSPDLGIESDHGRFSSLEATVNMTRPFLKTLELTESMSNLLSNEDGQICNNDKCCTKTKELVNENNDLRKKLIRTHRALEETVSQLRMANQRKKQVEKTICKQIHKTSQVLRKAKANLDNGSDHEVLKK